MNPQWTLAVKVGLPVICVLGLFLIAAAIWMIYAFATFSRWSMLATVPVSLLFLGGAVVLALIAYWPLHAEYHQYRTVTGQVEQVSSRFVGSGDGTDQKFVVQLKGMPQPYGVKDTRAALLKPGDDVTLRCIRIYDYGSNNAGYDCKWGQ